MFGVLSTTDQAYMIRALMEFEGVDEVTKGEDDIRITAYMV